MACTRTISHFTSFYLNPSTTTVIQLWTRGLLWTSDWNRSYTVPFTSWKYVVEKRHTITRQCMGTYVRHKLDFQQQINNKHTNYKYIRKETMFHWHQVTCKIRVLHCGWTPPPRATYFNLRFLYLKKNLVCSFGFVTGLKQRYCFWDCYWYQR
jgi:hypothetical protein